MAPAATKVAKAVRKSRLACLVLERVGLVGAEVAVGEGRVEASFRLTPERFAEGLGAWLTQRGKGEGEAVVVEVTRE